MNKLNIGLMFLAFQGLLQATDVRSDTPAKYPNCENQPHDMLSREAVSSSDGEVAIKTFKFDPCWDLGGYATWHRVEPHTNSEWDLGPEITLIRDQGKIYVQGYGWLRPERVITLAEPFVEFKGKDGKLWCSVSLGKVSPGKGNTPVPSVDTDGNPLRRLLPAGCQVPWDHYRNAQLRLKWEFAR